MSSQPPPQQAIFTSICYFIASSINPERANELRHVLDNNGGVAAASGLKDPKLNTVVSNSNRFEGWEEIASRQGIDIVTEQWVDRSLVLGKLQAPHHYSADPAMIFSGITACATDLPPGDIEVLSAGISALGGQWRIGFTKEVTHLFALNPSGAKYGTAMHFKQETGVTVLVPHWFDDAVRLGMGGLPTKSYEWPDPEVLKGVNLTAAESKAKAKAVDLELDSTKRTMYATVALFTPSMGHNSTSIDVDTPLAALGQLPPSTSTHAVWKGRKVLLSRTLELYRGRRDAVQSGIQRAGGTVLRFEGDDKEPEQLTEAEKQAGRELSSRERIRRRSEANRAKECDVLITRWRYGRAYVVASQTGKAIGTLAWLFNAHSSNTFTNPMDQILHYPFPKRPIEGFSNHIVSLTNYTGEAREYLKKLISTMGARFTPSMTGTNTVLVAATLAGTKADKAQAWSIPVVNHTWLEDCFVQWRNLTPATEKYIVFPTGVNFATLLGERGVGVGKGIEGETEELSAMVFEEDEVVEMPEGLTDDVMQVDGSVQDEQEMELQMPNGTGASAREVEMSLQEDDAGGIQAQEMEVEVVPSSTATRHIEREPRTLKPPPPATPQRSPIKPVVYSSKAKQNKRMVVEDENGYDDEDFADSPKARSKSKTKSKEKAVASSGEEEEDSGSDNEPSHRKPVARKGKRRTVDSDDDSAEPPAKSKSLPKVKSTSNQPIPPTKSKTAKEKAKSSKPRRTPESEDDDDDVEVVEVRKETLKKATVKEVEAEEDEEEEEDVVERKREPSPPMKIGKPTGKRKVNTAEKTKANKGKKKEIPPPESDDEVAKAPAKPTSNQTPYKFRVDEGATGLADAINMAATPSGSSGLLKKPKADARTRVKKAVAKQVGDEDSGVDEEPAVKTTRSAKAKEKGKSRRIEESDVEIVQTKGRKAKERAKQAISATPRRFHSSDGEDQDEQDDQDDDSLPAAPHLLYKSESRRREKAKAVVEEEVEEEPPIVKSKAKNSRRKAVVDVVITSPKAPKRKAKAATDDEDVEPQESKAKASKKPASRVNGQRKAALRAQDKDDDPKPRRSTGQQRKRNASVEREESTPADAMDVDEPSDAAPPRRNAAAKARQHLHDTLMPDLVNFEAQMKKSKKGRRSGSSFDAFAHEFEPNGNGEASGKRKKAGETASSAVFESEDEDEEVQPKKKRRVSDQNDGGAGAVRAKTKTSKDEKADSSSSSKIVLLTTQVNLADDVTGALTKLGVTMTTRASECTHLIAKHLVRTEKFLCALARAPYMLNVKWATASAAAKKLLPEDQYLLSDQPPDDKYKINLAPVLERARRNQGKMLEGKSFYITPKVQVDRKLLKNVVGACGGVVSAQTPTLRILSNRDTRFVISCKEDQSIWRPIAEKGHTIYNQELLLMGILKQQMEWDNKEFIVNL